MKPDDFWNSTFEEVLLVIKGYNDGLRFHRQCAWMILSGWVKDLPPPEALMPLAYDADIKQDDPVELYRKASQEMANFNWPSKN